MQQIGKDKRLKRIFSNPSKRIVITPLDDSLLAGPIGGLENLKTKTKMIASAKPDAIIGFQGLIKNFHKDIGDVPTILNLTGSTTRILHTRKTLVGSVELAIQLGADAVAVHVNISSKYETEMLKILGDVSYTCNLYGIPLMGIMYPRTETVDDKDDNYLQLRETDNEKYTELVAHAVRVGVELGVDFIKTQYTGSAESFSKVVQAACQIPVVIAGGVPTDLEHLLNITEDSISAGGAGISFGRNIFSRNNPAEFIAAIKQIVHEGKTAKEIIEGNLITKQ